MPFVFIDVIAETNLRVHIVSEQVDAGLVCVSVHCWELEKSFFDGTIVIYVNSVFEHKVAEVLIRLYKVIEHL